MGDQHGRGLADARLRRPAVDPAIPSADRALLTAPGIVLTPARRARPPLRRDCLPRDPARRLATVDGAAMGLTSALLIAVFGTTPLAVGILVLQGSTAWESASSNYALLLAEIMTAITIVILAFRVGRFGQLTGRAPAEAAARTHHGHYLSDQDFDASSRVLLRRAQDAIDTVTSSEVCRADVLDRAAVATALADQEWDIAVALRDQARLRARRAELSEVRAGPATAAVLERQAEAARLAQDSTAARVESLEHFAAEVRQADAAYLDWQQASRLAGLHAEHLDMLARTVADEHGVAEIEAMSQQARALRLAFREPPG
jgi:hypothetical protein